MKIEISETHIVSCSCKASHIWGLTRNYINFGDKSGLPHIINIFIIGQTSFVSQAFFNKYSSSPILVLLLLFIILIIQALVKKGSSKRENEEKQ